MTIKELFTENTVRNLLVLVGVIMGLLGAWYNSTRDAEHRITVVEQAQAATKDREEGMDKRLDRIENKVDLLLKK